MKIKIITIAIIICVIPFALCHAQNEKEKGLEKFRNGPLELCEAIEKGNIKAVKAIIKKGINVDLPAKKDGFPLFYAAGYGRPEIARLLIQAGANVNIKDSHGDTALHIAIRECYYKVAEILINSGADVNAKIEKGFFPGFRPLHTAVNGKKDIPYLVSLLISKGAEVNRRDAKGKTPLNYAIMNRFSQSEQILLKHEKSPGNIQKSTHFPVLKSPYLGQKPPGMTHELFAPGIISTEHYEHGITFSPKGDEIYFTRRITVDEGNRMFYMELVNGTWTKPSLAPFASPSRESSPNFSPDGIRLFFNSRRPPPENFDSPHPFNVWMVHKKESDWEEPEMIGPPIMELFPMFVTQAKNGTIYFTGNVERGIYRARLKNGKYDLIQRLPDVINSRNWAGHPFIDPEERYIIFDSNVDEQGTKNLYISFMDRKDEWTESINMNQSLDFPEHAAIPHVSFDGKYLFFSSRGDIYWVDAKIIEGFKPKQLK